MHAVAHRGVQKGQLTIETATTLSVLLFRRRSRDAALLCCLKASYSRTDDDCLQSFVVGTSIHALIVHATRFGLRRDYLICVALYSKERFVASVTTKPVLELASLPVVSLIYVLFVRYI